MTFSVVGFLGYGRLFLAFCLGNACFLAVLRGRAYYGGGCGVLLVYYRRLMLVFNVDV